MRTRQGSQRGEGKWFYHKAIKSACQMETHASDVGRTKGPSPVTFLFNFSVICGQII